MKVDWRDSVRTAGDLAILGFAVTAASLPLLTAGAAVGTASEAVRHLQAYDSWPPPRSLAVTFRRRLVPGLWAGPLFVAGLALVLIDLTALRRGLVPGGGPMLSGVLAVAGVLAGWAALVAVLGGRPREAYALAAAHPGLLLAASGVVVVAVLLALLVHPALVPVLAGFVLYALHAVVARLHPVAGRPS
jgi:hypothetical protein